ncbi:SgcJ/EcaC family oxidoreductase [Pseudomonas sp. N040]|uniref:SgcJ/EcaC family oxidoreductase n=1 Tax=Pseudomonas sp. N040 TaxID=2785325 RepID=UPI0018A24C36|nr:SgcJ/EcaC family oxidoreductase [Pseudomonas sp. N040]MBF7728921.1 SgcJ/EcaC family oxidoreductase [Pseudomonas sp. N040]MBW7012561.1 SgcJ/EcaC family oxidoreductase [Pseudomonas sp. N040]
MQPILALSLTASLLLAGCSTSAPVSQPPANGDNLTDTCKATSQAEIAELFERWNQSLLTGDPSRVVANYAVDSVLLPTVSNMPRMTPEQKEDYFHHFLENQPSGKIDSRTIQLYCNTAVDVGLYTFTFAKTGAQVHARFTYTYKWDGQQWLITSHHSSAMPENKDH